VDDEALQAVEPKSLIQMKRKTHLPPTTLPSTCPGRFENLQDLTLTGGRPVGVASV
jgi:hypothetical protein